MDGHPALIPFVITVFVLAELYIPLQLEQMCSQKKIESTHTQTPKSKDPARELRFFRTVVIKNEQIAFLTI